jgi:4-hydroxybenzoate polyprenyltransferase
VLRKIMRVVIGLIGLGIGYSLSYFLTRIGFINDLAISTGYAWYFIAALLIIGTGLAETKPKRSGW